MNCNSTCFGITVNQQTLRLSSGNNFDDVREIITSNVNHIQNRIQEIKMSEASIETFITNNNNYSITRIMNEMNSSIYLISKNTTDSKNIYSSRLLYFYGTLPLIFFCIISIAVNIKILVSVFWIRRPLSPTLHISLSLAGADAFSSAALGIGLVMNSFLPKGLGLDVPGVGCFLLALEAVRLGAVIITMSHLVILAINHYLGILKPLHYLTIMTHRMTISITIFLWTLPLCFFLIYFNLIENEGFQSPECRNNTFLLKKKFRVMFSSLFFGPFILMVFIYAHIFRIVRRHQASRLRFSRAGSSFRRSGSNERGQNTSQNMARNLKAIYTTLLILGSFVIGWMPAIFLYVMVCDDCPLEFTWTTEFPRFIIYNAANCLIILKTLANPIIYAARMHEIQVATRRMHSSFCGLSGIGKLFGGQNMIALQRPSPFKSEVCRLASSGSNQCPRNESFKCTYASFRNQRVNTLL